MQIIRADDYQSWLYSNDGDLVAVDPWLTKTQVFPKLSWLLYRESTNQAFLVKNNLIAKVTHLIITAHFSDHLDAESLIMFDLNIPIYTTHEASKSIAALGFKNIKKVQPGQDFQLNSLNLKIFEAGKPYNRTTFAYSISCNKAKVFHEPHMHNPMNEIDNVDACILTVDKVTVLGLVQVSMGLNQAKSTLVNLDARYLLSTGIAPRRTKGLISFLLSIKESYHTNNGMPSVCQNVGDSLLL